MPRPSTAPSGTLFTSSAHGRSTAAPSIGGNHLTPMAHETKRKIVWDQVLCGASTNGFRWKWGENTRAFSLYTQHGSDSFGVLSIGTVKASTQEVASLLASRSQQEYEHKMAALHGDEFKHGAYIADIPSDSKGVHMSVRSATFTRPRWLQRDDEWSFIQATHFDPEMQRFEKLLTTLTPEDVRGSTLERQFKTSNGKRFRDVIAGYCVQPEETGEPNGPAMVRVNFYAQLESLRHSRGLGRLVKREASAKSMKQRLLAIAKDCDRLAGLVLRRRLGVQVLVDQRRVLMPLKVVCHNCERSPLMPKLCRVCGQGVCSDCSNKYERESHKLRDQRRRVRLEEIRVCDPCLRRVEAADYSYMSDAVLTGAVVFPDAPRQSGEPRPNAASDLKQLLHDVLLEAPSVQRKDAVMSVIRCVLDQDKDVPALSTTRTSEPAMLTPLHAESDYLLALDCLHVASTAYDQVETADMDGRAFALNPVKEADAPLPLPLTHAETQRQAELDRLGFVYDGGCDEFNIICDIAAKELDAFATIVTIVTANEQYVIASNVPTLQNMKMKREDSFCQHTIMSGKPLIVPHPEADVRFSRIAPVTGMGIRYYCGFPIKSGKDNTVIGTLCCVDQKKHELTETQFSVMQKLAQTASKVVKIQGERRRNSSAASSRY